MRYLFCLFIFAVSCRDVEFKRTPIIAEPSVLANKFWNLVDRAWKVGAVDLFQDFSPETVTLIDRIYADRLGAFVTELRADPGTQSNFIKLKNQLLGFSINTPNFSPVQQADFLEKTAHHPQAIKILIQIKDALYGPDGKLLKKILLGAANNSAQRNAFLAGQKLGDCPNLWHCIVMDAEQKQIKAIFSDTQYGLDLVRFSQSQLKQHLDAFSKLTGEQGHLIEGELMWAALRLISVVDYSSLDWLHRTVQDLTEESLKKHLLAAASYLKARDQNRLYQLVSALMPELREFAHVLVESLSEKTWANLDQKDLQNLLEQLSNFLTQYVPGSTKLEPKPAVKVQKIDAHAIQKIHIDRLHDFVQELLQDQPSEKNLIEIKNIWLDSSKQQPTLSLINLIETIVNDDSALTILLDIRDDLYGPEGQLLKKILLEAARDPSEQAAFLEAQNYRECLKKYGWGWSWWCLSGGLAKEAFRHYAWLGNSDKILFNKTNLNANLEKFFKIIKISGGLHEEDKMIWSMIRLIPILSYPSLAWLHEYIKRIDAPTLRKYLYSWLVYLKNSKPEQLETWSSVFGPQFKEEAKNIFDALTGRSLRDLDPHRLHNLLEQLGTLMTQIDTHP